MSETEEPIESETVEKTAEQPEKTESSSKHEEVVFGNDEDGCNISIDTDGDIIVRCDEPKKEIRLSKGETGTVSDLSERFTD